MDALSGMLNWSMDSFNRRIFMRYQHIQHAQLLLALAVLLLWPCGVKITSSLESLFVNLQCYVCIRLKIVAAASIDLLRNASQEWVPVIQLYSACVSEEITKRVLMEGNRLLSLSRWAALPDGSSSSPFRRSKVFDGSYLLTCSNIDVL